MPTQSLAITNQMLRLSAKPHFINDLDPANDPSALVTGTVHANPASGFSPLTIGQFTGGFVNNLSTGTDGNLIVNGSLKGVGAVDIVSVGGKSSALEVGG